MAWEYFDVNGSFWSTSTAKLKLDASLGYINRDTEVVSTTTGKRGPAGEIKGLVFPEDVFPEDLPPIAPPIEVQAERTRLPPEQVGFKYQPRKGRVRGSNPGFFDLEFRDAITPVLVSGLWALWLSVVILTVIVGLGYFSYTIWQTQNPVSVRLAKITAGSVCVLFFWLFLSILVRIVLESAVVLFRIADYLKQISQR